MSGAYFPRVLHCTQQLIIATGSFVRAICSYSTEPNYTRLHDQDFSLCRLLFRLKLMISSQAQFVTYPRLFAHTHQQYRTHRFIAYSLSNQFSSHYICDYLYYQITSVGSVPGCAKVGRQGFDASCASLCSHVVTVASDGVVATKPLHRLSSSIFSTNTFITADDLNMSLPDAAAIEKAYALNVLDPEGNQVSFGSLIKDQEVILVFIR